MSRYLLALYSLVSLSALFCQAAISAEVPIRDRVGFILGAGYTFGGERIKYVKYTNGTSDQLDTGNLYHFFGGIRYPLGRYTVRVALGYHNGKIGDSQDSVTFTRYPLDIIAVSYVNQYRFGVGLSYQMKPVIKVKGFEGDKEIRFRNSLGLALESGYRVSKFLWLDARVGFIRYEAKGISTINGSFIGIYGSINL